jgi:hypothetical protein
MTYHVTNKNNKKIIIANIPWNPATYINRFHAGDWISKRVSENNTTLAWVYHVTGVTPNTVQAVEFQRVTPIGLIGVANSQVITLSPEGYHPIKVLTQERHGAPLRVVRELPSLTKPPLLWKHFDNQYSSRKILQQAYVDIVEVGMATWKAINSL